MHADLGCVSIKVIEAGTNVANFDNMDTKRAEKTIHRCRESKLLMI
jgi:hypothetical protein